MPKGKPSRRMPEIVAFRCTADEREDLRRRAALFGLSGVSELLRVLAFPTEDAPVQVTISRRGTR